MNKKAFWFCLITFLVIYLALRIFWLGGDPGIQAVWEYGYNATDEGYYLDGGKEKFLWNFFVDLPRIEAFTYGFSAGTHWLCYLAHLAFGLSTWTWRIPFFLINCCAWIALFVHISRKSNAVDALLLCIACSAVPMLIAYERTASNDVLIGSLAVLAYVLGAGRSRWRLFAAAVVTGLIVLVKPSVWVLIPIVAAGVLQTPKFSRRWMDALGYLAVTIASMFVCKVLVAAAVMPEARQAGISAWEVVRRTTTHYPLPDIFDIASHLKGLSAFPRDPSYALLGVSTVFFFVLPILMALKNLSAFRLNGNTLLFASVPAYVAAINVMNTQYTHYFIPALMFMPIVINAAAAEIMEEHPDEPVQWKSVLLTLGFTVGLCAVGIVFLLGFEIAPQIAQQYYSRIYNFPSKNVWGATATIMGAYVVLVVGGLACLRGLTHARRYLPAWTVTAFFASSVSFAAIPAFQFAPYIKQDPTIHFAPMALVIVAASLLIVAISGVRGRFLNHRILAVSTFAAMAVCYVATPNWRTAACELLRPPTHYHEAAAKELAALLPSDAIVIGERSNQMLMSLPIRTATTFATNSDPIPVVDSILKKDPSAKLYALADSQHAYNLQHYREHAREYALHPIKVFRMPSFGTGALSDVYLCRIENLSGGK